MKSSLFFILLIFGFHVYTPQANAHPLAPYLLKLTNHQQGIEVVWRSSLEKKRGENLTYSLPNHCQLLKTIGPHFKDNGVETRDIYNCSIESIRNHPIAVSGLDSGDSSVLLSVSNQNETIIQKVLNSRESQVSIPEKESTLNTFLSYLKFGIFHLAIGLDHILFIFGLIILHGSFIRLLKAITAFTIGHSITLSLATYGISPIPSNVAEILVALTLVVMACELLTKSKKGLLQNNIWSATLIFGLIHGLGFANVLKDTGIEQAQIPLILFSFNMGIEIAQLSLILLLLTGTFFINFFEKKIFSIPTFLKTLPIYSMGFMAAYWFFERL